MKAEEERRQNIREYLLSHGSPSKKLCPECRLHPLFINEKYPNYLLCRNCKTLFELDPETGKIKPLLNFVKNYL